MSIMQSPTVPSSGSKGLSFRALLPFGPNKSATPISPAVSPPTKSPTVFGTFRRSISVVRPSAAKEPPVIDIATEAKKDRRSLSLSDLQKPLPEPSEVLIEPADLSTIIEADTSGVSLSKHLPSPSPSPVDLSSSSNSSALNLSTSRVAADVLDAMIASDYASAGAWHSEVKVIDASSDSLDIEHLDPELARLLSPNNLSSQKSKLGDMTLLPKSRHSPLPSPVPSSSTSQSPQRPRLTPAQSSSSSSIATRQVVRSRKSSIEDSNRRPPPSPLSSQASTVERITAKPAASSSPSLLSQPHSSRFGKGKERERVFHPPEPSRFPVSRSSVDIIPHTSRRASPSPDNRDVRAFIDSLGTPAVPRSNSTPVVMKRRRKRSMSVDFSPNSTFAQNSSTRAFSTVRARQSPSELGERTTLSRSKVDLGPRTIRVFKAAGLLGDEPLTARPSTESSRRAPPSRPPSRMQSEFGVASEPGFVSPPSGRLSRMTQSEWRSPSVLDSTSPTTHSSRDTPRSGSTAPTSVLSFDREKDRFTEELDQLKHKHSLEIAALLSALSDSQLTTRLLREENDELRDRIALLENQRFDPTEVMDRLNDLQRENDDLKQLLEDHQLKQRQQSNNLLKVPRPIVKNRLSGLALRLDDPNFELPSDLDISRNGLTSTPAMDTRKRRLSTSSRASSVFQIPPSEMSLLLEDNVNINLDSDRSGTSTSTSPEDPTVSIPLHSRTSRIEPLVLPPMRSHHRHAANKSVTSTSSVLTRSSRGSPKSLFPLRPEDELHLGDLGGLSMTEESDGSVF